MTQIIPLSKSYGRFRHAVANERLPCALLDLEPFEQNIDTLLLPARRGGKLVRIATKSLRCIGLLQAIIARGGSSISGLMAFDAHEARWLASLGFKDILVAYPACRSVDCDALAQANALGSHVSIVVDSPAQIEPLARAAREAHTTIPLVVDVDVSYRPLGSWIHVGVRRSPLRELRSIVSLARRISRTEGVSFDGVMAYEAHVAGLPDSDPSRRISGTITRYLKTLSVESLRGTRTEIARALRDEGLVPNVFNGGGTGSIHSTSLESVITEVTVGSGFVNSHLFDHYAGLSLHPALFFALQVVRMPADRMVTCHGGGYVASGTPGWDRLPVPVLPEQGELLGMEGAGEVQTPVSFKQAHGLALGDPVFFRHAKAGELAERFAEYLFVRGQTIERREPTYRGMGRCFG